MFTAFINPARCVACRCSAKASLGDATLRFKRQKRSGNTADLALRFLAFQQRLDFHRFAFAADNCAIISECL